MPTKAWEELPMKLQPKEPNPDQLIMGQRVTFPPPSLPLSPAVVLDASNVISNRGLFMHRRERSGR